MYTARVRRAILKCFVSSHVSTFVTLNLNPLCGAFIPVGGRDSSYESESADILCSAHPPCRTLSPRLLILRQRPTLFLGSPCGTFAQSCFSLHYRNLSFVVKQRSLEKLWANTSYQP